MVDALAPSDARALPHWVQRPRWDAPRGVSAAFTSREGGVSTGPYASLNLATHVGDAAAAVIENRRRLRAALALAAEPLWLSQRHGSDVVDADALSSAAAGLAHGAVPPRGDVAVTRAPGRVLAVLVADCLPVLLARADGSAVAVAHAGWRGLAAGVLETAVRALGGEPQHQRVWLGPAIDCAHFEVGEEVRTLFCARSEAAEEAFERNGRGRWQCDLYRLARQRLAQAGVSHVTVEQRSTFEDETLYSFRRDGRTGRIAALVWIQP